MLDALLYGDALNANTAVSFSAIPENEISPSVLLLPIVMDADLGHHPPMMPIISGSMGSLITQGNNLKLTMKLV